MKFSIITPTHKRIDGLMRAVASVQAQTYQDWEIIIVNDSPADTSYARFFSHINDPRIRYISNISNLGVNTSRNKALDALSINSEWVIFLDDDDYFAPDTLATYVDLISKHKDMSWFVTNRALQDGTSLTKIAKSDITYSYAWEYLILKRCKGDATHCISTTSLNNIRFSKKIKQGEEWFFFFQLGLKHKMFYHDHNSTISEGYSTQGLNDRKRSQKEQLDTVKKLYLEGLPLSLSRNLTFLIYISMRVFRAFIRHD